MNPTTNVEHTPRVELRSLDELWFQVSGTLCNLECTHCFISCSPHNDRFGYLSLDEVANALEESQDWGVKEYYFTGGEPFLNRDLVPMLKRTLNYGPATVLTNGTVLKPEWLQRFAGRGGGEFIFAGISGLDRRPHAGHQRPHPRTGHL